MLTNDINIDDLYGDAIRYLDENYTYFLTNVLNIGSPMWTTSIPTAAVTMDKDAKNQDTFGFIFNPKFGSSLTTEQFAFILAHETLHIVLYHLNLSLNFDNKEVFNVAADAVINDYLDGAGLELIDGICRGESLVGYNCANCTVTDVYHDIINNPETMKKLGQGECESCGGSGEEGDDSACGGSGQDDKGNPCDDCGGSGKGKCPDCNGCGKQGQGGGGYVIIDSHDWMHNPENIKKFKEAMAAAGVKPEDLPDDLEEILTEAQNTYEKTQMAGNGVGKEEFLQEQKVTIKWAELLEKVDPDMFRMPGAGPRPITSFRQPRRKLAGMASFSDAILPCLETPDKGKLTNRSDRKPSIVVALDTSGSIGTETANKFVNLGRSIPQDKVNVFACTFTSRYQPLDLDNPRWNSGGTCFSAIEDFIRTEVLHQNENKYPSAVVVVTDGHASFPRSRPNTVQAEGWFWLLLGDYEKQLAVSNFANSHHGFKKENFDTLDGYVDGKVNWY